MIAFLFAMWAAPMSAAGGSAQLSSVSVTPRTGTPKTQIVISVVYKDAKGSPAEHVTATIGAKDYRMSRVAGGDWATGVTFRWTGRLPLGTLAVVITARAKDHSEMSIAGGSIKITAKPAPTPTPAAPEPTPKPTPKPTARPTPKPTSDPAPRATERPVATTRPVVRPTPSATPADEAPPTPSPTSRVAADQTMPPLLVASIVGAIGQGGQGGSGPGTTGGSGGPRGGPADVPTGPSRDGKSGGGKAWGPLAAVLSIVGLNGPIFPSLGLAPTLVTTTGAVATAMAFGLFGRRRREDELSDDVLARAAAAGVAIAPNQLVGIGAASGVPPSGIASGGPGVAIDARPAAEPLEPSADEALMPRWRRPSLLQARKFDPVRDASGSSPRLTFGEGLVGPLAGRERKVIRYRVVRLLDSPDELRGSEIGYLDQGDEVQLLEKYGAYWLVLSPDGQQGWLHKMVLGEIVDGDEPPPVDAPVATMPTVADSWTMGESDIDADVFDAYLESRRRSA